MNTELINIFKTLGVRVYRSNTTYKRAFYGQQQVHIKSFRLNLHASDVFVYRLYMPRMWSQMETFNTVKAGVKRDF